MDAEMIAVGEQKAEWSTGAPLLRADYDGGSWHISVGFPDITADEVYSLKNGLPLSIGYTVQNDLLFLLLKVGSFDWFDMPFEPAFYHQCPDFPLDYAEGTGAPVILTIIDTANGTLKGLRLLGLSRDLSCQLHNECLEMYRRHSPINKTQYDATLYTVYEAYPTPAALAQTMTLEHCHTFYW